ncbi:retrovirus-related pol polyprotein from transposon TNT 1-94 [Tanacetum coccineum]
MCDNDTQNDQNAVKCDDERVALANLIANLKLDTSRTLGESNSIRDSCLVALQNKQTEFERYKAFNDRTVDYDKLERKLNETLGLLAQKDIDIKEGLKVKAYEISVVKEKHDELVKQSLLTKSHYEGLVKEKTKVITDLKLKEEKDIDKMISMENQLKFLNEIVYKRSQSIQTIHMLAPKCPTFNGRPTFANPMYLKKAQYEKPCLYVIPHDQSDPANRLVPDREETLTLEKESREKLNKDLVKPYEDLVKRYDYINLNSLYEIFKPPTQEYQIQLAHSNEILPPKARQDVRNTNVIKPGMYQIDTRITQTRAPQFPQTSRNTNPRVSTSTGIIHRTNVSRPQLRSTQMKDKVVPYNSHVKNKKTEVEDHHRISSISNKTKSVTASTDSLKFRTLNVNVGCATCGKCVFNSNHDARVYKYLDDVNARTKKPKVVPISTRKPKSQVKKSVATLHKKIVASESTTQKSKSYYRMLDLQGNDLLTGNRGSDLYIISLQETTSSTPICLMAKASPTQAWLWHRRLSHLNFDYINLLSKKDVVIGLPKQKYVKDQLCSSCEVSKAKRSSFKTKVVPSSKGRLNLLHMNLCGPIRVASINRKNYILVIIDDYSRYTLTLFLRSKDETPEV